MDLGWFFNSYSDWLAGMKDHPIFTALLTVFAVLLIFSYSVISEWISYYFGPPDDSQKDNPQTNKNPENKPRNVQLQFMRYEEGHAIMAFQILGTKNIRAVTWYAETKDGHKADIPSSFSDCDGWLRAHINGAILASDFQPWDMAIRKSVKLSDFSRVYVQDEDGNEYYFEVENGLPKTA